MQNKNIIKKILFSLLFLMFPLVSCSFSQEEKQSFKIDTSNWKTYAVGRYLIDLPEISEIYWYPLTFSQEWKLKVVENMTIEEANAKLKAKADKFEKTTLKTGEKQLISFTPHFGANNLGSLLINYSTTYNAKFITYQVYFVNINYSEKQRVYYYESETYMKYNIEEENLFINWIASHMSSFNLNEAIEIKEGMYFDSNFLYEGEPFYWPAMEEIGIEVKFLEYPGIVFEIYFKHYRLELSGKEGKRNTSLAGNPAIEELKIFKINNVKHYDFFLSVAGQEEFDKPLTRMSLKNPIRGIMRNGKSTAKPPVKIPSFSSDEEAIAFWEALKKSVRWRPDGVKVPLPEEANGKPYFIVNDKIIPAEINE